MVSDVLPTGWFGVRLAQVSEGDTVLVLGAGVVGQCVIASAFRQGAGRVLVVDGIADRLETARAQNAGPIDFHREDPVTVTRELTCGIGAVHHPARGTAVDDRCLQGLRSPPCRPAENRGADVGLPF